MDADGLDVAEASHVSTHHHCLLLVLSGHDLQLMGDLNSGPPLAEKVLQREEREKPWRRRKVGPCRASAVERGSPTTLKGR